MCLPLPTPSSLTSPSTFGSEGGALDGLADSDGGGNDGGGIWEAADSNALKVV